MRRVIERKKMSTIVVPRSWTVTEVKRLRTGYRIKSAPQLANELGRTVGSVRGKIRTLGLIKNPPVSLPASKPGSDWPT